MNLLTDSRFSLSAFAFDFVLRGSFGLLVTLDTNSFLVNFERRSRALSGENGDRGRDVFLFGFETSVSTGASKLTADFKDGEGGRVRQESSPVWVDVRVFSEIALKIEVSEYERALVNETLVGTVSSEVSL